MSKCFFVLSLVGLMVVKGCKTWSMVIHTRSVFMMFSGFGVNFEIVLDEENA